MHRAMVIGSRNTFKLYAVVGGDEQVCMDHFVLATKRNNAVNRIPVSILLPLSLSHCLATHPSFKVVAHQKRLDELFARSELEQRFAE